jgi:hypothetical protein
MKKLLLLFTFFIFWHTNAKAEGYAIEAEYIDSVWVQAFGGIFVTDSTYAINIDGYRAHVNIYPKSLAEGKTEEGLTFWKWNALLVDAETNINVVLTIAYLGENKYNFIVLGDKGGFIFRVSKL